VEAPALTLVMVPAAPAAVVTPGEDPPLPGGIGHPHRASAPALEAIEQRLAAALAQDSPGHPITIEPARAALGEVRPAAAAPALTREVPLGGKRIASQRRPLAGERRALAGKRTLGMASPMPAG
jgi:hypothetical protein